jgi:hypothetical protein
VQAAAEQQVGVTGGIVLQFGDLLECQARDVGVVHSGRLAIKHEDGTEVELGPGEAYVIEPGHDAWVAGDERFVGFEFESRAAEDYAKG